MPEQILNLPGYTLRRQALRNQATLPEKKVWAMLRQQQMGVKFRRQHGIGHYIVDFYCPERRIVIEIDGDSHFSEAGQQHDQQRDAYLRSLGLSVLRFTNAQVMQDLEGVHAVIHRAIYGE